MFTGWSTHSIDVKGRLAIPSAFRDVLKAKRDERLVVTTQPNTDRFLVCYPIDDWKALAEKVSTLPELNPNVQALKRVFFSRATECTFDKQGRILIPQPLREKAALESKAVLAGSYNYIEIWDPDRWDEEMQRIGDSDLSSFMAELGV